MKPSAAKKELLGGEGALHTPPARLTGGRTVVWFSCGATSAVAAKLAVEKYRGLRPVVVAYCDTGSEHPDNARFLEDVERWLGVPIRTLRSTEYKDTWDVWRKTGWLVGPRGARCTTELKKKVRQDFEQIDSDIQVFGFDADEKKRADRFRANNPLVYLEVPLIERGLTKGDCKALLTRAGIELPAMYALGFGHANCFGPNVEFISDRGVKTFFSLAGQQVRVRNIAGRWVDAEVKYFGKAPLTRLTLSDGMSERVLDVTEDHRWLVQTYPEQKKANWRQETTASLQPGDRLPNVGGPGKNPLAFVSKLGAARGFAFGDGSLLPQATGHACRMTFCGEKRELLPLFAAFGSVSRNVIHGLPSYFKDPPSLPDSTSFLWGWLAGYFAADGCATGGNYHIDSMSKRDILAARSVAAVLGVGYKVRHAPRPKGTNFSNGKPAPIWSLSLSPTSLFDAFFLRSKHRAVWDARAPSRRRPRRWAVVKKEPLVGMWPVYCCVVPDGETFTLDGHLLTMNCTACPKGGMGYWNRVRGVFPDEFARMAKLERELDVAILKDRRGKRRRLFLDELPLDAGRYSAEPPIECGIACEEAFVEIEDPDEDCEV